MAFNRLGTAVVLTGDGGKGCSLPMSDASEVLVQTGGVVVAEAGSLVRLVLVRGTSAVGADRRFGVSSRMGRPRMLLVLLLLDIAGREEVVFRMPPERAGAVVAVRNGGGVGLEDSTRANREEDPDDCAGLRGVRDDVEGEEMFGPAAVRRGTERLRRAGELLLLPPDPTTYW